MGAAIGSSPFLQGPIASWVASNELAFAIRDSFPASPVHTLVVPRRLVADWGSASQAEHAAILELVATVKHDLRNSHAPDGFTVGVNEAFR